MDDEVTNHFDASRVDLIMSIESIRVSFFQNDLPEKQESAFPDASCKSIFTGPF